MVGYRKCRPKTELKGRGSGIYLDSTGLTFARLKHSASFFLNFPEAMLTR